MAAMTSKFYYVCVTSIIQINDAHTVDIEISAGEAKLTGDEAGTQCVQVLLRVARRRRHGSQGNNHTLFNYDR